jgi:multicomponent Na+:H+ antiporter subunit A
MSGRAAGGLLAAAPAGLALYFVGFIAAIASGEVFVFSYDWAPSLAIKFSFLLDGLSLLFAILISAVGALILIYSNGYLAGHPELSRFYVYILMFAGSMLGLVLADNLITLFLFWELTSLSSYLLIGFDHEREEARAAEGRFRSYHRTSRADVIAEPREARTPFSRFRRSSIAAAQKDLN